MKFRLERDSMGEVRLPKDSLYGAQTARALQNFKITGRAAHPELITAYLWIKRAAASANTDRGVLKRSEARLIQRAVDQAFRLQGSWPLIFPVDPYQAGAGTSQNMNINEVIANLANRLARRKLGSNHPIHPNDHVNRSQSTNDTYPTAMRLALLQASAPLCYELELLGRAFERKARLWRKIPKAGRTHLQDAVPMRLGQEIGAYAKTLRRLSGGVTGARDGLLELGIGGSAVGTGVNVPIGYSKKMISELGKLTGERVRLSSDLCEAMQSQAPVLLYSSALRAMALELTRICNDLRLLASGPMTGLAELKLPAVQPGSSIMPGKVNPSILEMANQVWFAVIGFDQTVAYAVQAGQLELNVMMPVMAHALLEATKMATAAIRTLRVLCIEGMEPNPSRLRKYFESTPQAATALTPILGYEKVAALVKEAVASGESVFELCRERKQLPEAKLRAVIDGLSR